MLPWKNISINLTAVASAKPPLILLISSSHLQTSFLPLVSSPPRKILLTNSNSFIKPSLSQFGAQWWKTSLTQPSKSEVWLHARHLNTISPIEISPSLTAQSVRVQWEHTSQPIQRHVLTSKSNLLQITHMQRLQKPFLLAHISQGQSSAGSWFWQDVFMHLLWKMWGSVRSCWRGGSIWWGRLDPDDVPICTHRRSKVNAKFIFDQTHKK